MAEQKYLTTVENIIGLMKEEIKKALIYFNIAWSLDSSDTDCEKAINLIMSKNKKAL